MAKLLPAVLAFALALPLLSRGSVTVPGRSSPETLAPAGRHVIRLQYKRTPAKSSRSSKRAVSRVRGNAEEPVLVILYGGHPWSWM